MYEVKFVVYERQYKQEKVIHTYFAYYYEWPSAEVRHETAHGVANWCQYYNIRISEPVCV